jgi:hypothetical protein
MSFDRVVGGGTFRDSSHHLFPLMWPAHLVFLFLSSLPFASSEIVEINPKFSPFSPQAR